MDDIDYIKNNYNKINIFDNNLMDYLINKKIIMLDLENNEIKEATLLINMDLYFKYSFQLLGHKWYSFFSLKKNMNINIYFYYPREYWKLYIFKNSEMEESYKSVFYNLEDEIKKYL